MSCAQVTSEQRGFRQTQGEGHPEQGEQHVRRLEQRSASGIAGHSAQRALLSVEKAGERSKAQARLLRIHPVVVHGRI